MRIKICIFKGFKQLEKNKVMQEPNFKKTLAHLQTGQGLGDSQVKHFIPLDLSIM